MSNVAPQQELPRILIIGGGVHAGVLVDCVRQRGNATVAGYCDRIAAPACSMKRLGVLHLGSDADVLAGMGVLGINAAILGIAGIGHAALRQALAARFSERVPQWWTAIHPAATVSPSAAVAEGATVFAGAIVNPLARIGRHVVINTGAIVEHDCEVDDFAVVSPRATLCGGVSVARAAFVGAGATVLTGVRVGERAIVGAGAVVLRDVDAGATVVGNPGRVLGVENACEGGVQRFEAGAP